VGVALHLEYDVMPRVLQAEVEASDAGEQRYRLHRCVPQFVTLRSTNPCFAAVADIAVSEDSVIDESLNSVVAFNSLSSLSIAKKRSLL
jgi:hypothetical protein